MDPRAIFGIDILMSFVSSVVIANLYVWPGQRHSCQFPNDQYVTKKTGRDVYTMVRDGKKCKSP